MDWTTGTNAKLNRRPWLASPADNAHVQGFIILDHYGPRFDVFRREMEEWVKSGRVKAQEDVVDGLLNAPAALSDLLQGRHAGKVVVRTQA